MTHEELLAICDNYSFKDSAEPVKALRAVVELHKPTEPLKWRGYRKVGDEWIIGCSCGSDRLKGGTEYPYPCPTIQKIMDELK